MDLIYLEFKKLYANRFVWILFSVVFLLNIMTSYYVYQDKENGRRMYSASAYKQVYLDIETMGVETGYAFLNSAMQHIMDSYSSNRSLNLVYTNSYDEEIMLLSEVRNNIWQCMHYDVYLNNIEKQANTTLHSGMAGAYSIRNLQQTLKDVERMRELAPVYGPSKGIELYGNLMTTDLYVLLLLLVIIVQLVTAERDSHQLILYKTTCRGRMHLAAAKIVVILISVCWLTFLFQGVNFIMGQQIYGFGNLQRPIQSVNAYIGCPLFLSVWQYIVLHFCAKLLVYSCLSALALFVAVKTGRPVVLYFAMAVCYGISAVCYYGIHSSSYFSFWKYVNIFAFLKTGDIIGIYRNLNVFGVPYSYRTIFIAVAAVLGLFLFYSAILQFDSQREAAICSEKNILALAGMQQGRTGSLFLHEAYKLLINGKLLVIFFAYGIFVIGTYKPVTEAFYIPPDAYYDAYIDYLKGPVTSKTQAFLNREADKFERLLRQENATGDSSYYEYVMRPYDAFIQIKEIKTPYLREVGGEYLHDTGYRLLTGDVVANQKDIKMGLLAVIVLIFPLSYIYGIEYQQNTIVLLNTSYYGRWRTRLIKFILGLLTITIVYLMTYGVFYYSVISEYGLESIHAPACSLENLMHVPNKISLLAYLVIVCIMRYIGFVFMMCFLFYLSSKVKSVIGTCLIGVLFLILPLVFAYIQVPGANYLLLNPFIIGNV